MKQYCKGLYLRKTKQSLLFKNEENGDGMINHTQKKQQKQYKKDLKKE